jgi:hypothetical protein
MPSIDYVDEHAYNDYSDDDDEIETTPLDTQNWIDWYSNDLLNMWMGLRVYREDTYLTNDLMKDASFHDFCDFVYKFSHGFPSNRAT